MGCVSSEQGRCIWRNHERDGRECRESRLQKIHLLSCTIFFCFLRPARMGLKFEFTPRYSDDGIKPVPLVSVVFINPKNGNNTSVQCRIDSGADEIVLPAEVGIMLGIQLEKGEALELQGIAQDPVRGYRHNLKMQIENDTHFSFTVPC